MDEELLKRAEDLAEQCSRRGMVTNSNFLTPAESYLLSSQAFYRPSGVQLLFSGGRDGCERTVMFCLPEYLEPEYFDAEEYINAIEITAHFAAPGHRDYMGALLGMGVERDRIGDILVAGSKAYVFCLPGVYRHLLSIEKVGRCGVTCAAITPSAVPLPERQVKRISFSVMSPRLDAVVGGMFNVSRTEAAKLIAEGRVSVNYKQTLKTDLCVKDGTVITLQGHGKGTVASNGGVSRKGRIFMDAEILK